MATIDIHNLSGAKVGTFDLADEIFGAVNEDLLWEAVKHYRAGQHRGTHATKARWQVSGSGKKLWKQKGTGRARIGSIHGAWSGATFLQLCFSAQEAVRGAAFGAGFEVCRWQAYDCECV